MSDTASKVIASTSTSRHCQQHRIMNESRRHATIFTMQHLPDGTYDVIVIDVENLDDGDMRIELTITLGPHVGDVVTLRGRHVQRRPDDLRPPEPLDLQGVCGTLRVRRGIPSFRPERGD